MVHAFPLSFKNSSSVCGQTNSYSSSDLLEDFSARKCEQCVIVIVTGIRYANFKFFYSHIPIKIKVKCRKLYREWRMTHGKDGCEILH